MARGRCAESWDHTAAICATIINMHRDPRKSRPVEMLQMNPYRREELIGRKAAVRLNTADSMKLLKRVFIDHRRVDQDMLLNGKIEE